MSMLLAMIALLSLSGDQAPAWVVPAAQTTTAPFVAADAKPALDWIALVDAKRWADSWQAAGTLFRSRVTQETWAGMAQAVRQPLGLVTARTVQAVDKTTSLPNLPAGHYAIVQLATTFANKPAALETVVLVQEAEGWKVIGYFIR